MRSLRILFVLHGLNELRLSATSARCFTCVEDPATCPLSPEERRSPRFRYVARGRGEGEFHPECSHEPLPTFVDVESVACSRRCLIGSRHFLLVLKRQAS